MKHDEKFPIEPLSDESWRRIEQRLFSPAAIARRAGELTSASEYPAGRSWLGFAAAALLALAAFGLHTLQRAEPERSAARDVSAQDNPVETLLGDAVVRLEAGALARLSEGDEGALVELMHGEARFSVPSRKGRAPFAVQAGAVRVEVVGTRFRVARDGGKVEVVDEEGRVRVVSGASNTLLEPGTSWSNVSSASLQPEVSPLRANEPRESPASAGERSARAATSTNHLAPHAERVRAPQARAAAVTSSQPASGGDEARARFEQAARLEASDPEQALSGYRSLAASEGPWAETALYALGRLTLERGDRARAIPLLHSYLRRYPRGANAADVRSLLAKLGVPGEGDRP